MFTPREGETVDESYVKRISSIVKNKITFSESVVDMNYYDYLLNYMAEIGQ